MIDLFAQYPELLSIAVIAYAGLIWGLVHRFDVRVRGHE